MKMIVLFYGWTLPFLFNSPADLLHSVDGQPDGFTTFISHIKAEADQDTKYKLYEFKYSTLTEEQSTAHAAGSTQTISTIYIDDYGARIARFIEETTINTFTDQKTTTKTHTTMDKEYIISHKEGDKVAYRMENMAGDLLEGFSQADAEKFAKGVKDAMNAKTTPMDDRRIEDRNCTCDQTTSKLGMLETVVEACRYKGYVMYESSTVMDMKTSKIVTSFDEKTPIPPEVWKFKVKIEDRGGLNFRN